MSGFLFFLLSTAAEKPSSISIVLFTCLSCACCCFLFLVHFNTPEPQTASGLHCYPASFAKHHGRLLEAGVRLQLLLHRNAQWNGRSAGTNTPTCTHRYLCIPYLFFLLLANLVSEKEQTAGRAWSIHPQTVFMNVNVYWEGIIPWNWEDFTFSFVQSYIWPNTLENRKKRQ